MKAKQHLLKNLKLSSILEPDTGNAFTGGHGGDGGFSARGPFAALSATPSPPLPPNWPCLLLAGTKVVATVGPSCQDVDALADILNAGVVGCRVDLTWGEAAGLQRRSSTA
jgi:hypothetical protein